MYTTYHLASAQEVSTDILESIKVTFKSKPITIIVEEDDENTELASELRDILDERLSEDENTYHSASDSIERLKRKYSV